MTPETTTAPTRLLTLKQFSEAHPAFSVGSLRHFLFYRETNGLEVAVRRVGRRLLLLESAFFAWIEATNAKGGTPTASPEPPRARPARRSTGRGGTGGRRKAQAAA